MIMKWKLDSFYIQEEFYDSPIENAMPLAVATANVAAFVVYNSNGSGYYNATLPFYQGTTEVSNPAKKPISCRCGANKKYTRVSSTSSTTSPLYSSRCKCLKHRQHCTALCHCSNCKQKVKLCMGQS